MKHYTFLNQYLDTLQGQLNTYSIKQGKHVNKYFDLRLGFDIETTTFNNGYDINAGKSIITINNGTTFNKSIDESAIRIVKFNEDTIVDNEGAYQLKTDYYNYINNVVTEKNAINFSKVNSPELKNAELDLIINQLDEFVKATTNAYAFATSQAVEYNFRTVQDNLNELLSR